MKKLMIAMAAVAFASAVNAAQYAWSTSPTVSYGDTTGSDYVESNFYLMRGDANAAESFVNTVLGAGESYATTFASLVASAENSATYDMSSYTLVNADQGSWNDDSWALMWDTTDSVGSTHSFYQVVLDTANKGVYVSEVAPVEVIDVGGSTIGIYNEGTTTFGTDVTAYQGSGWYTVDVSGGSEGVPEPTSGLLLLVGLAGLALKRKIA